MGYEVRRTEHVGAKDGGGYWGTRFEAKRQSAKRRRQDAEAAVREWLGEIYHDRVERKLIEQ